MTPLLTWAGGKRRLTSTIVPLIGQPRQYFEPFVGAGAVWFNLKDQGGFRGTSVLGDANPHLVEMYKAIQGNPWGVIAAHGALPRERWREEYVRVRTEFNEGPRAGAATTARFLWLNRTCFNGVYRVTKAENFATPVGNASRPRWATAARMAIPKLTQAVGATDG